MPMFEYACDKCGKVIEVLQKVGEPPLRLCGDNCVQEGPEAGSGNLVKVLSVTGGYSMGRGASLAPAAEGGSCGTCGMTPGSCQFES